MRLSLLSWLAVVALAGACKSKKAEEAPPAPPPVVTSDAPTAGGSAAAPAASADPAFGAGEGYFGGSATPTNVMEWKLDDGTTLRLVVVGVGTADGRQQGVLRVYRDGKGVDVGDRFSISSTGESWAELKQLPNGRVAFRFGDAGEGRRARNIVILRYDNAAKEVRVAKRWYAEAKATEPTWLTTGTYAPTDQASGLCAKVVKRMVACAKDEEFRTALFVRDEASKRDALAKDFDAAVTTWKQPADVKKQCAAWASDDVVETTFSDETKLASLAADAETKGMTCGAFGREVVDEGGLPR